MRDGFALVAIPRGHLRQQSKVAIAEVILPQPGQGGLFDEAGGGLQVDAFGIQAATGGLHVVVRDVAYMVRIRVLTDNFLSWRKSFQVIMIWEFASAVIPPSLGGGFAVAIYLLNKEKIELGKSISVILFSSFGA